MIDTPLPGMPEPPPPRTPRPAPGERFSRYKAAAHKLCDVCVQLIHLYGQDAAPYPKAARWRRATDHHTAYTCEAHKETRL